MICGIYKITNQINNKVYIGQSKNIERRWVEHKKEAFNENSSEYCYPLYQAIRKYGLENFTFEILEECPQEELNQKEIDYISLYESYPPNKDKGYNQTKGGNQGCPYKITESTIINIIQDLKQCSLKYYQIAKKYGLESSVIQKINYGELHYHLENINYPIRKPYFKIKVPYFKPIRLDKINGSFCKCCGVKISNVSNLCKKCFGKSQKIPLPPKESLLKDLYELKKDYLVAEKYNISTMLLKKWKEELSIPRKRPLVDKMYEEEYLGIVREEKPKIKRNFSIKQIDKITGKLIQTFSNVVEASKYIQENYQPNNKLENIQTCIHNCLKNQIKTACGFRWEHLN